MSQVLERAGRLDNHQRNAKLEVGLCNRGLELHDLNQPNPTPKKEDVIRSCMTQHPCHSYQPVNTDSVLRVVDLLP